MSSVSAGSRARDEANRAYLVQHSVAAVLNDMVTFLLCKKPEDELDALIGMLEQKQQQAEGAQPSPRGAAPFPRPPSGPRGQAQVAPRASASHQPQPPRVTSAKSSKPETTAVAAAVVATPQLVEEQPQQQRDADSVFAVAESFLQADDELFGTLLSGGAFGPSAAAERIVEAFGGGGAEPDAMTSVAAAALLNNERMLTKLLSVVTNEAASDGAVKSIRAALLSRPSAEQQQQQQQEQQKGAGRGQPSYYFTADREGNASKLRDRLERERSGAPTDAELAAVYRQSPLGALCFNIERRIARSAAVRRCIVRGERIDDPAVCNTVFFVACSAREFNRPAPSASAEIDAILSELVANAMAAIGALEQQLEVVSRQQQQHDDAGAAAERLNEWIQQCTETVLTGQKLRERLRATMRAPVAVPSARSTGHPRRSVEKDADSDEEDAERGGGDLCKAIALVSPHGVASDDVMQWIRSCRGFFRDLNALGARLTVVRDEVK